MAPITGSNPDSSRIERSRQGNWRVLSRWAASRSSSGSTSLSSAVLKMSDREDDESRGPAEPRHHSPIGSPGSFGRQPFWRTSYQPDEGSSVHHGPAGSPGPSGRQSFWRRSYQPDEDSSIHHSPIGGPGPSGRHSFWRTSYQPDEDSSIHHSLIGGPGPSERQPFWRTSYQPDEGTSVHHSPAGSPGASGHQSFWSHGEDSSGLHRAPPASSRRVSARSAEKTVPEVEPPDRVRGARQPDASLQHPAGRQPTRSATSTPRCGEPALEPRAKRAATSMSGKNDAPRAKPVAEVDRATQGRTSSPILRPSKQQKQGTAAKRPVEYRVLKEIALLRASIRKLIPRLPFERVVREIMRHHTTGGHDLRIERAALEALQEASEATVVAVFERAGVIAHKAGRVTITSRDMETVLTDIRKCGILHSSLYA
ncbi:uncharacterized protein LOC142575580 [Dermacentor variabilis]|uniref:uncharacterized protein LOC142575580 n=1 Tax=Dermacentor variabilis TaxID=34621 RepID=UPI003F5C3394